MRRVLTRASRQLFSRPPDERFETLSELHRHCQQLKEHSRPLREPSTEFRPLLHDSQLLLQVDGHQAYQLNDWSFSQLCALAGVSKDTVNRLCPATAALVLKETLHEGREENSDLQALVLGTQVLRAVNGAGYQRLWSAELTALLLEFAADFTSPQKGFNGATGLYAGEQDVFAFMIDPTGWAEIGGQAFAPGFFVWNSEVGRRTVGISTFWFQAVCANHIVWDVTEVVEFSRKHTGNVQGSLAEIRRIIECLVQKRDERRDGFARLIAKAMHSSYGQDAEEVRTLLAKAGFTRALAKRATDLAREQGRFTLWSVVDALTRLAREEAYAGSRTDAEARASALLGLAAA